MEEKEIIEKFLDKEIRKYIWTIEN